LIQRKVALPDPCDKNGNSMEYAMPNTHPAYLTVDFVLSAIADWVNQHRSESRRDSAFGRCSPDEVRQIAKELGISANELREVADKGPRAADLLTKMLVALDLDPAVLAKADPATLRDMQRLCSACEQKGRCEREFAAGKAAAHFHDFCPNAFTIDALLEQTQPPFQQLRTRRADS
jgi:hypothetical protein